MSKPPVRVTIIGTRFLGQTHAFAYAMAGKAFDLVFELVFDTIADIDEQGASRAVRKYGFARATGNWRDVVMNPAIDVVSITTPNALHTEMSLAAIFTGQHVYCEKPLAPIATDAAEMADAAEAQGVKTQVGFNHLCNPIFGIDRDMIQSGELGEIRS